MSRTLTAIGIGLQDIVYDSDGNPIGLRDGLLNEVTLQAFDDAFCSWSSIFLDDSVLCAANFDDKGTCFGDSGGPLLKVDGNTQTHVGALSFGFSTNDGTNVEYCVTDLGSGYARTSEAESWLTGFCDKGFDAVFCPTTSSSASCSDAGQCKRAFRGLGSRDIVAKCVSPISEENRASWSTICESTCGLCVEGSEPIEPISSPCQDAGQCKNNFKLLGPEATTEKCKTNAKSGELWEDLCPVTCESCS